MLYKVNGPCGPTGQDQTCDVTKGGGVICQSEVMVINLYVIVTAHASVAKCV